MSPTVDGSPRDAAGEDARPSPFADAYWLPGVAIAAGEYPGALHPDHARHKVGALLDAGVRRFVDLTEARELDPYRGLVEEIAAERGVTVTHVRLPIRDVDVPSPARMREILDALDSAVGAGEPAYVHCWGGVGRTGTVVGCWLVRHGASPDDALATVAARFATMSAAKRGRHPEGSPQTRRQRDFVRDWPRHERATPGRAEAP